MHLVTIHSIAPFKLVVTIPKGLQVGFMTYQIDVPRDSPNTALQPAHIPEQVSDMHTPTELPL
jgi:hypothetical protein